MKLVKKQSKKTYLNKDKKEVHYYNFFIETDNKKRIQIKPAFEQDARALDVLAEYEGN